LRQAVPTGGGDVSKQAHKPVKAPARAQENLEEELMKFRPLQDRILIKRIESEERTAGGLIIPDTAKEKPQQGEVIAVGNGKKNDDGKVQPLDVKVGDRILFGKYSGSDIKIDGTEHLILREDEILGILEK
jgi:chaperonin GroES